MSWFERSSRAMPWVLLAIWATYALLSTGTLSRDPHTRYLVAQAALRVGTIGFENDNGLTVEHEGRHYSVFFPGQTLIFTPIAAGAELFHRLTGIGPNSVDLAAEFLASVFLMPFFAVLALAGYDRTLRQLGVPPPRAMALTIALAFGTTLWVWGTMASEELILAACSIWAISFVFDARHAAATDAPRRVVDRLGAAGLCLAVGMIHRSTFVVHVLAVVLLTLPLLRFAVPVLRAHGARFIGWFLLACGVAALLPLYNWLRFDDPLVTGYAAFYEDLNGVFGHPILEGLRGHLISPGESIFLYVPWLVLVPLSWLVPRVWRTRPSLMLAVIAAVTLHLLIYSAHTFWSGAHGWSVRFHVSVLPLVLLPVGCWLGTLTWRGGGVVALRRVAVVGLFALSVVIQLAGMALNTGLEHFQHREHYRGHLHCIPVEAAWTWEASPFRLRFVNIVDKLRGEPLLDEARRDDGRIMTVWNIFPLRAAVRLENAWLLVALWTLWWVLLGVAIIATRNALRLARIDRAAMSSPAAVAPRIAGEAEDRAGGV